MKYCELGSNPSQLHRGMLNSLSQLIGNAHNLKQRHQRRRKAHRLHDVLVHIVKTQAGRKAWVCLETAHKEADCNRNTGGVTGDWLSRGCVHKLANTVSRASDTARS